MIISLHLIISFVMKIIESNRLEKIISKYQKRSLTEEDETLIFDPPVYQQRYGRVYELLTDRKWDLEMKRVVDFGCAEFSMFTFLKQLEYVENLSFVDIDRSLLEEKVFKLKPLLYDHLKPRNKPLVVDVYEGSVGEPEKRLRDFDAVIAIELIEHLYPDTLEAFPYNVFHFIKPKIAIVTTPNVDFNVLFSKNKVFRHYDHKFEWTREQFISWAVNITERFPDYEVQFEGVGKGPEGTEALGQCSQLALFIRKDLNKSFLIQKTCKCSLSTKCDPFQLESNQLCQCICSNCSPRSEGICTYESYSLKYNPLNEETKSEGGYNLVESIDYPFHFDTRSEEEKILDEIKYCINTMGQEYSNFYNEDTYRSEIPLRILEEFVQNKFRNVSIKYIQSLLVKEKYSTGLCKNELCVIYNPCESDLSDSDCDKYGFDSEMSDIQET